MRAVGTAVHPRVPDRVDRRADSRTKSISRQSLRARSVRSLNGAYPPVRSLQRALSACLLHRLDFPNLSRSKPMVPLRKDVPLEHTWDSASVFATDELFEKEIEHVLAHVPELEKYKGQLGES